MKHTRGTEKMLEMRMCVVALGAVILWGGAVSQTTKSPDWIRYARISGHPLQSYSIDSTIERADREGALGIELDNDITGRYESFLDPAQQLRDIARAAEAAHRIGNHAFVYIAGLE